MLSSEKNHKTQCKYYHGTTCQSGGCNACLRRQQQALGNGVRQYRVLSRSKESYFQGIPYRVCSDYASNQLWSGVHPAQTSTVSHPCDQPSHHFDLLSTMAVEMQGRKRRQRARRSPLDPDLFVGTFCLIYTRLRFFTRNITQAPILYHRAQSTTTDPEVPFLRAPPI